MMDELFAFLEALASGDDLRGEIIGRTTVNNYTIDTCETADCGWETAVWKDNFDMIIVARYDTKEKAQEGHDDWCAVCARNPVSAWSVQTNRYEYFDPKDIVEEDE